MAKMKMSTASDMCTLICALIVCTLVSTARTADTSTADTNVSEFDSGEDYNDDWTNEPTTATPITNWKYDSKPTLGTPSVKNPNESVTDKAIENSTKPENEYIPSDKKNSYTTEPIPTIIDTQSQAGPHTGVQLPSTTLIAIRKNESTTTPGSASVTDLNVKPPQDVIGNSTSEPKSKNGYNQSHNSYSSTESILANDSTRSKPTDFDIIAVTMSSKPKWSTGRIPFYMFNTERPTRYYRTTERIRPTNNNCISCDYGKKHLKPYKNNEKETTTTKIWGRFAEYKQWDQQRHMRETTTSIFEGQLEESKKRELQQKVLEMESNRFGAILNI